MIITGGLSIQMVVLSLLTVKSLQDRVWFPDHHVDESSFCFGPVITTEAHLALSGVRIHSTNTAELTDMCEALSFLGSRGLVTHDEQSFFLTLYMLLAVVWARTWPEHTSSCRWHVNNLWSVFSTGYGSPSSTCMVTVKSWVTTALTMPMHVAHLDSSPTTAIPHAGLVVTLTLFAVLMAVITSGRF